MDNNKRPQHRLGGSGFLLAPIHLCKEAPPLRLCILARRHADPAGDRFMLLREVPGSKVYLGAVCDTEGRLQEWVEVWVQTVDYRDLAFSDYKENLANSDFDLRWQSEHQSSLANLPDNALVTGMEAQNPRPLLIYPHLHQPETLFARSEPASWELCRDDALLKSFGLPLYSTSTFRYLHQPGPAEPKTFLATSADAPVNPHVQGLERLKADDTEALIFNTHAGFIRVARFCPLALEDYFKVLEGGAWQNDTGAGLDRLAEKGVYAELESWSANPKGMPFLLHGKSALADHLNEIFFLKLSALLGMFKEVRRYVKAHQLPLLNLTPVSFGVRLLEPGEQFPAFWSAKCLLLKPGQAHPLKIKTTEKQYFVRLGKTEVSLFLPEGLGAHSSGIGSVRRRQVLEEADGIVLEGTLVAEDYLGLDQHDLLWFKLPVGQERLECYAHVYTSEAIGPKEARFRTVPMKVPDAVAATLKNTAMFARAPYAIWPLLSSPCDLHSLGVIAIRALLANYKSDLSLVVDDIFGLARRFGKEAEPKNQLLTELRSLTKQEPKLYDLISPQALIDSAWKPQQARSCIALDIWLETVAWLLRLFPGMSKHSYCSSFGDVSPLALENVFDAPIQDLEKQTLRLRSLLTASTASNREIAAVILEQLKLT